MEQEKVYLYRLTTNELVVGTLHEDKGSEYALKTPHVIHEQPGENGGAPRVMLQPAIPHNTDEIVTLSKDKVVFSTLAPDNIVQGYRQAMSSIIMPDSSIKTPVSISPLDGM